MPKRGVGGPCGQASEAGRVQEHTSASGWDRRMGASRAALGACTVVCFAGDVLTLRRIHWYCQRGSVRRVAAMRPESGVLAWVLLVELFPRCEDLAHMGARPRAERLDGLPQGAAELGQLVIHALRSGG